MVRQHVMAGHDVQVIASTEVFDGKGGLTYTASADYIGSDGARVLRIPYAGWLPHKIMRKLRIHTGVYDLISEFAPNAILFHGATGNEIVTVARYARDNPDVLFYVDSHEDFHNSAKTFVSKRILHGLFYRHRLRAALPNIRKILCVNIDAMDYLKELHSVTEDKLEFYPLGGFVLPEDEIARNRVALRAEKGINADAFVFLQSGKMTPAKHLALSLRTFADLPGENLRFWITGLLAESVREEVEALIAADSRVSFLGWQSPEDLNRILCAVDAYVQPGTQSATMQNALCCGCPVILNQYRGHDPYRAAGAVVVERDKFPGAMADALTWDSAEKRTQALEFARCHLDYKRLADRILHS